MIKLRTQGSHNYNYCMPIQHSIAIKECIHNDHDVHAQTACKELHHKRLEINSTVTRELIALIISTCKVNSHSRAIRRLAIACYSRY